MIHVLLVVLLCGVTALISGLVVSRVLKRALPEREPATIAPPKRALPVINCSSCAHFDFALGQREMERNPVMMAAGHHIPPWRMQRVLKTDENGAHLPIEEQGIDKKVLALDWRDFGACMHHRELRARGDTCPMHTPRDVESAS